MPESNKLYSPQTKSLDSLFTLLSEQHSSGARSPLRGLNASPLMNPVVSRNPLEALGGPMAAATPPPTLTDPADLGAAQEWLQNERNRLDQFTRQQMALIHQQHQALLAKEYASEEALVVRSQEVNREIHFLTSQTQIVQDRARQLAEREALLAEQMEKLSRAQEEFLAIQQTSKDLQKDTEAQRAHLEGLQAETILLQEEEAEARQKFERCEVELKERQKAWEKKQAELTARQAEMEQRYLALEQAEQAIQRRMAEVDELEERLCQELETQERRLAAERRDLQGFWDSLSSQRSGRDHGEAGRAAPPADRRSQTEMEQRYLALEQAEQAIQRRMAEVDEMEERLRQELEGQERRSAAERRDLQGFWDSLSSQRSGRGHDEGSRAVAPVDKRFQNRAAAPSRGMRG